jgi:hypothetical protein
MATEDEVSVDHLPVPNTEPWLARLAKINPQQAEATRAILKLAGRLDVCSICGDDEDGRAEYLIEGPGLNASLCQTCKGMQESMYRQRIRKAKPRA